jgi:UDP-N-acetylmuramoyl-L-alanyl-D-glutamate--2,6-diaminopimelate ligase
MGGVAAKLADVLILTSDNPRSESPEEILRQIELGIPGGTAYQVIEDRRSAIGMSFRIAKPGDLVLIAGKGHEVFQEFGHHQVEFSDVVVAKELHGRNCSG